MVFQMDGGTVSDEQTERSWTGRRGRYKSRAKGGREELRPVLTSQEEISLL